MYLLANHLTEQVCTAPGGNTGRGGALLMHCQCGSLPYARHPARTVRHFLVADASNLRAGVRQLTTYGILEHIALRGINGLHMHVLMPYRTWTSEAGGRCSWCGTQWKRCWTVGGGW